MLVGCKESDMTEWLSTHPTHRNSTLKNLSMKKLQIGMKKHVDNCPVTACKPGLLKGGTLQVFFPSLHYPMLFNNIHLLVLGLI